jgi:hypothetical protein
MTKFELTLNKRSIKFNVGIGFLGEYQEKHNTTIDEVIKKINENPWKTVPSLMYESALYANRGELDFDERDLIDMIDDDGSYFNKTYFEFLEKFLDCMKKNVPKEDVAEEDSKKK